MRRRAEHGISQPRVSQIVGEVGEWLDQVLPGTRRYEKGGAGTAVGTFIAESQIDFLMEQTMHEMRESKKDKVTEKSGTRGDVQWTEIKTVKGPVIPVGLFNVALRLAQAKAKLAGVDITGRTQREMAIAEERERRAAARGQGTGDRGQETGVIEEHVELAARSSKKPLIKKLEKVAVEVSPVQPQVQTVPEDKLREERDEFVKNRALKQLINHLREDPQYACRTEKQFQEYAQFVWDADSPEKRGPEEFSPRKPRRAPSGPLPENGLRLAAATAIPDVSQEKRRKRQPSPRPKAQPHSPYQRRREFLAPLAAG